MPDAPTRHSPVHDLLEARRARWRTVAGAQVAVRFGLAKNEREAARSLALCDVSALPKLGLKGPGTAFWLAENGVRIPGAIYETSSLEDGGLVVRAGEEEFLLESGMDARTVPDLASRLGEDAQGVYRIEREDATFLLCGTRAVDALAQTCGIDFAEAAPNRLILTRVAGVSCGILPQPAENMVVYRLWVGPSSAIYLWEQLTQILSDLGGAITGAAAFYPNLDEPT
jgi:sarcosine oxidase subunit gamma